MIQRISIFSCLLLVLFSACETEQAKNVATIKGQVEPGLTDFVYLHQGRDPVPLDSIEVQTDGTYEKQMQIDSLGYYILAYGEQDHARTYLKPGVTAVITYNGEKVTDKEIAGVVENAMLLRERYTSKTDPYTLPFTDYVTEIRSVYDKNKAFINEVMEKNPEIDKALYEKESVLAKYSMINSFLNYSNNYPRRNNGKEAVLPDNYEIIAQEFYDEIEWDNKDLLKYSPFRYVIINYFKEKSKALLAQKNEEGNTAEDVATRFRLIEEENIKSPEVRDYVYKEVFSKNLTALGVQEMDDLLAIFVKNVSNENFKEEIQNEVSAAKQLKEGMPVPALALRDKNNNKLSLSDFKGKYVYVDFWATWCGPCKGEFPYLKELKKEYAGKPIEFVGLSLDVESVREKWEADLIKYNLNGPQLFAGDDMEKVKETFMIGSIPHFMFIDDQGNIISYKAPRPSSEEIRPLLNKYL